MNLQYHAGFGGVSGGYACVEPAAPLGCMDTIRNEIDAPGFALSRVILRGTVSLAYFSKPKAQFVGRRGHHTGRRP